MCGDDVKVLNVYINRKKVIMHDADGKTIDTENTLNNLYKKKRQEINKSKKEDAELVKHIASVKRSVPKDSDEDDDDQGDYDQTFISEVENLSKGKGKISLADETGNPYLLKLKKDTELVTLKIEKEKILVDKAAGKLLPIDVAASLLQSQAKAIFTNFDNAIENIAGIYCQIMANGDMKMYTRIVEEGKRALSVAIEKAGADADKDLDMILTTFSQSNTNRMI